MSKSMSRMLLYVGIFFALVFGWYGVREVLFSWYMAHYVPPAITVSSVKASTKTWQSFFQALLNKVEIADLCIYMTPWITNFVKKYAKLYFNNMKFVIPVPNTKLPVVGYTLKTYIRNGGKYTRKYNKSHYPVDLR